MIINKKPIFILSIFTFLLLFSVPLNALNVKKITLYNGLEFYLIKNNSPVITYATWVNAGGIDENSGKQGVAHFLEHMMFKDNKNYTGEKLTAALQSTGGIYNAFTSYDFTVYYNTVPAYSLSLIMKLEASRLQGLLFNESQYNEERKVILEERGLRIDNNPIKRFYEDINYYIFPNSNYGRSLIGSVDDIKSITLNDLKSFYHTYYIPSNVKIFIIGNVSFKELKKLAFKYYNSIPKAREKVINYNLLGDSNYKYNSYIALHNKKVIQPILGVSYLAPSIKCGDIEQVIALILLQKYLASSTNKFYTTLVKEKNLVNVLNISYNPFSRLNTNFFIYLLPKNKNISTNIKNEVNSLLDDLILKGISPSELNILFNQFKSEVAYTKDDNSSFLLLYANLIMLGLSDDKISKILNLEFTLDYNQINKIVASFLSNNKTWLELNN